MLTILCHLFSVLPRRFWVGAAPSPLTVRRPALGFNSQRPALICGRLMARRGADLLFGAVFHLHRPDTSTKLAAQDQHTPDKDHKIDRRFDVPRW